MSQDTLQSKPISRLSQDKNFGFLATLMPDGSPQVTPTWVHTNGNHVIINTALDRLKHKNISRDTPRCSFSSRSDQPVQHGDCQGPG